MRRSARALLCRLWRSAGRHGPMRYDGAAAPRWASGWIGSRGNPPMWIFAVARRVVSERAACSAVEQRGRRPTRLARPATRASSAQLAMDAVHPPETRVATACAANSWDLLVGSPMLGHGDDWATRQRQGRVALAERAGHDDWAAAGGCVCVRSFPARSQVTN